MGAAFSSLEKIQSFFPRLDFVRTHAFDLAKASIQLGFLGPHGCAGQPHTLAQRSAAPIGYGVGGGAFFLTDRVAPELTRPHRSDAWLHLLKAVSAVPN